MEILKRFLFSPQLLRIDIPLGGENPEGGNDELEQLKEPTREARAFLDKHPMAKIIIVVDAHCMDNGFFVYEGDSAETFKGCPMSEVNTTIRSYLALLTPLQILVVIPPEILCFVSNKPDTPKHGHSSLILNLACGASVTQLAPRTELIKS